MYSCRNYGDILRFLHICSQYLSCTRLISNVDFNKFQKSHNCDPYSTCGRKGGGCNISPFDVTCRFPGDVFDNFLIGHFPLLLNNRLMIDSPQTNNLNFSYKSEDEPLLVFLL